MVNTIIVIILSLVGAVLYRLGGKGSPFNTKVRDLGLPCVMLIAMTILKGGHWIYLLCFILMFSAQTTYFGFVNKYFNKNKFDKYWWNWLLVGLIFSVSMIPYAWQTGHWIQFLHRSLIVTPFTVMWSEGIDIDWLEEGGRGWIQIITLPIL